MKIILTRVSFDTKLFEKELRKALLVLVKEEIEDLKQWCYENFRQQHEAVLTRCFTVY